MPLAHHRRAQITFCLLYKNMYLALNYRRRRQRQTRCAPAHGRLRGAATHAAAARVRPRARPSGAPADRPKQAAKCAAQCFSHLQSVVRASIMPVVCTALACSVFHGHHPLLCKICASEPDVRRGVLLQAGTGAGGTSPMDIA